MSSFSKSDHFFLGNLGLKDGNYFTKTILTLGEQLIIGYISMNLCISTNYFKIIREGYYFL